ncbi:cytochrome c [Mitsuaria sp. GD03876]|uniref:c-type cytochrome n=1 Tax=Mitsuaria sp. GD03876 TaxID=2975399 RepID=UPI002448AF25|nr:cytochrome c [Mitsuaria sp. GD03876]MDH0868319.1 cytochrome c [Mitsuaria sp. GD03876]
MTRFHALPVSVLAAATLLPGLLLLGCGPAPDEPLRRWQVESADLDRGRVLMTHYQCGSCHVVTGVPGGGQRAPELARFGRRAYIAGQLPNTPETLQRWLLDPPGQVPGTTMPRLGLSEQDARDVAGYLLSLK